MRALLAKPAARWSLAAFAVLLTFVLIGQLSAGFFPSPQGPTSSSYATSTGGLAAYAELLSREGHPVSQLRRSVAGANLSPDTTLVVLDPDALLPAEGRALRAFAAAGGRLLIGGTTSPSTLNAVLAAPPRWQSESAASASPLAGGAETAGVETVESLGAGGWATTAGAQPLLGGSASVPLLLRERYGSGKIELLADASPLQNQLLDRADNAQLGLNLAGAPGRPVVFDEAVHGYGQSRGLAALPARWRVALAILALAMGTWALARGRRLGPAREPEPPAIPARAAYAHAMALIMRRSAQTHEATELVRTRANARLPASGDVSAHARRRGLGEAEIEALLSGDDLAGATRALVHLRGQS